MDRAILFRPFDEVEMDFATVLGVDKVFFEPQTEDVGRSDARARMGRRIGPKDEGIAEQPDNVPYRMDEQGDDQDVTGDQRQIRNRVVTPTEKNEDGDENETEQQTFPGCYPRRHGRFGILFLLFFWIIFVYLLLVAPASI